MPKKSSKKSSKKRAPATETTLVPHKAPNLTDLLERAKSGKLSDVQQYLSAGGSPNVLVEALIRQNADEGGSSDVQQPAEQLGLAPLLSSIAASQHSEAAASIRALLEAGADVDAISSTDVTWEQTALMVACQPHNLQVVQALLQGGANPCYQASTNGTSALHLAAAAGCTESCNAIHTASSGRALELTGKGYPLAATPLIAACAMRHLAVVELLCTLGADVNNSCVATGITPLIVAAQWQDTSILQFLLMQDGIKVDQCDGSGTTALMKAVEAGKAVAVKLLLDAGADASIIDKTSYFAAVAEGHLQVLRALVQHGADVTVVADGGYTLLMQAATSNQPHTAKFLIDKGVSVHTVDDLGAAALHYAALSAENGAETMRLLLTYGADINACTRVHSGTPLQAAARSGQLDRVELLLAAGADVTSGNDVGATALHEAVFCKHTRVVKLLLEHGADAVLNTMQCKQRGDCDPFFALTLCNDAATLKLLLTAGADVHAATSSGDTCLHIAARHNYSAPVVCLLIKAGADMHAVNSRGKSAAEVAHDNGNTLIQQLLVRAAQQA
jgi:uncharacterized protein